MRLIAKHPILYLTGQYAIGDELPANDPLMVEAWLVAKTAAWEAEPGDEEFEDAEAPAEEITEVASATSVTAQPGLPGVAVNGETEENLVGRIPKTIGRSRK